MTKGLHHIKKTPWDYELPHWDYELPHWDYNPPVWDYNPKTIYTNDKNKERQTPKIRGRKKSKGVTGEDDNQ
jgi:hypothetical protein